MSTVRFKESRNTVTFTPKNAIEKMLMLREKLFIDTVVYLELTQKRIV